MNGKINLDSELFKKIYSKYKKHLIYVCAIFVCFLVIIFYAIPELSEISKINEARKQETEKLKILNNNLKILRELNQNTLDSQFDTVTSALPSGKNFESILNSISQSAGKSGVSLEDFSLSVGDVSAPAAESSKGFPFIEIALSIGSSPRQLVEFLSDLSKTFPLSEITSLQKSDVGASVRVRFYYKSFLTTGFSDYAPFGGIGAKEVLLLDSISPWKAESFSFTATSSSGPRTTSPF